MIWLLATVATYRLTRLLTADKITESLRIAVIRRSQWFGYLFTCDWCMSIWIGMAISVATFFHAENNFFFVLLAGLTFSAATGFLAMIETRLEA
jgi:hypothetical protein